MRISDSGKYTLSDQNWLSPKQNQSSLNWPVTINADKLLGIDKGEQHEGVALNHWGRGSNRNVWYFVPFSTHIWKNFVQINTRELMSSLGPWVDFSFLIVTVWGRLLFLDFYSGSVRISVLFLIEHFISLFIMITFSCLLYLNDSFL